MKYPQSPGFYLWFVLDLGYLDVGVVQVLEDDPSHLQLLRKRQSEGNSASAYLIYTNDDGKELTMYHQAHDHLPKLSKDGLLCVDGFVPFDIEALSVEPFLLKDLIDKQDS